MCILYIAAGTYGPGIAVPPGAKAQQVGGACRRRLLDSRCQWVCKPCNPSFARTAGHGSLKTHVEAFWQSTV